MARKLPQHLELGDKNDPVGWNGGTDRMFITLTYAPVPRDPEQLRFYFEVAANFPYKTPGGDLKFEIQRDCTVEFILADKLDSQWSAIYFMITGKGQYKHLYGDVNLLDKKRFSVKAKFNQNGNPIDKQSFNLNIDYGQGQDASGTPLTVPITIDPDVGNPRPPQMRDNAVLPILVPILGSSDV